jgi:hypothetical protein
MRLLKLTILAALTMTAQSCVKRNLNGDSTRSTKFTSVKMKMPTKIGDKDVTGKMDGYRLSVKKSGGDCVFTDIERSEKVQTGDVKIDASLKQGCDYTIMMSFGMASADGKSLEKIYLSSDSFDGKKANPTLVKKEDLKGKSEITIKACVSVTAMGATELGVSAAECPSVADDSVDGTIEPTIPQPAGTTTFKISEPVTMKFADQGASVSVTGSLTSQNPKTVWCGLALVIDINAAGKKTLYVDENVLEVKTGDKKAITTAFNGMEVPNLDPANLLSATVLESCVETKPEAGKKAADLMKECLASGKCPVVGPKLN